MSSGVLVLNADRSPLAYVAWQRAVVMLVSEDANGVPLARMFESDPEKAIHSQYKTIPFPRIIELTRYLYLPYLYRRRFEVESIATRKGILQRDRNQCCYCGKKTATTVDHVLPRSRGGKDTWENLVACCWECNNVKDDKLPEEAGMQLRWHPWRPDTIGFHQRKIWAQEAEYELASLR